MANPIFDVTAEDVRSLDDGQARQLTIKLCEAELAEAGQPASGLIAGGAQTAPDGGVDVRVSLAVSAWPSGFIPRAKTIFQVKATPMSAAACAQEMAPKGVLRPILIEQAAQGGAYVIVATRDDLAEPGLDARRAAMAGAAAAATGDLQIEFYHASRLAFCTNRHPGVALWVRHVLGRGVVGWAPYGAWAASDRPADEPFIEDPKARLRARGQAAQPVLDGLNQLRADLVQPGRVVRLIGLSGHGKTRLAQALFDDRLGTAALPPAQAIYGDVGRGVEPSPRALLNALLAKGQRAILVVDNCPPDVHRGLVEGVRQPGSPISLLSIEYDVGEDDIEDTAEYRLEAASDQLLDGLLRQRRFLLSEVDRQVICAFAGGNARIALALARTSTSAGSLAALSDGELLQRLFGRAASADARRAAEAAALVVSFDLDSEDGEALEWPILADLAGLSADAFHAAIRALQDGELVQRRGRWRAVLPQALALRLARTTLAGMRTARLWDALVVRAPQRLRTSFAHRLGQLHDSPEATVLAERVLAQGGLFYGAATLDELDGRAFEHLAPAAPASALSAIEAGVAAAKPAGTEDAGWPRGGWTPWLRLTRQIAYDPALFERAVAVMVAIAAIDGDGGERAFTQVQELFWIVLSATQAPPKQRFALIGRWIDDGRLDLAVRGLGGTLQTGSFTSHATFEFGARLRSYGWRAQDRAEAQAWFLQALSLVDRLGHKDRSRAAAVLAQRLRGLWTQGDSPLKAAVEASARAVRAASFDAGLWLAVCEALHRMPAGSAPGLETLERDLRPTDAEELFAAHVLPSPWAYHDPANPDPHASIAVSSARARAAGALDAGEPARMADHVRRLLGSHQTQAYDYGRGLAAAQPTTLDVGFQALKAILGERTQPATADIDVVRGYLVEAQALDPEQARAWLDAAVADPALGSHFVALQATAGLDDGALARLLQALDLGQAPVRSFQWLSGGRATDPLDAEAMHALTLRLLQAPGGEPIAVDLLGMRIHSEKDRGQGVPGAFIRLARDLIASLPLATPYETMAEHHLGELAEIALAEPDSRADAADFAVRLKTAILKGEGEAWRHGGAMLALFTHHPDLALDTFLDVEESRWYALEMMVRGMDPEPEEANPPQPAPIASAPDAICLAWAGQDPRRADRLAEVIAYARRDDQGRLAWTPLARALINGPGGPQVLATLAWRFIPPYFRGGLGDQLRGRRRLLEALVGHSQPAVAAKAAELLAQIDRQIDLARGLDGDAEQSFE